MAVRQAETLIASTIETLDNGVDQTVPQDGVSLLRAWLDLVRNDESAPDVATSLQALHDQLDEPAVDRKKVAQLVKSLGDETIRAARKADVSYQVALKDLGASLKDFANELK